jgi:3'-phosphoadenosine 5'-phosphosulfate sulfotransferase (PAPS reductase)/FAD synthetase
VTATATAIAPALALASQAAPLHHLDELESEAVHILRVVAGQCERPALLFSGGKDSAVVLHLATLAFRPARLPFPLLHIDTGHNLPALVPVTPLTPARDGERVERLSVRFRTVGDVTCTCPVASTAASLEAIVAETASRPGRFRRLASSFSAPGQRVWKLRPGGGLRALWPEAALVAPPAMSASS